MTAVIPMSTNQRTPCLTSHRSGVGVTEHGGLVVEPKAILAQWSSLIDTMKCCKHIICPPHVIARRTTIAVLCYVNTVKYDGLNCLK